ncbi:MAG: hypothetical protein GFH27_549307n205 [Chloroflexi bacterium AL-W]|nr:hypothetical protein [Chloroflexi bacterium AL-N1]NOK69238.1 hypothetical protein [Chloroflexi bacterium AL-N10]NOK77221.1 hypothetical protein [Chloroflexi bacterium AL-N5]NOK83865.1 hypothetical protein [Chloroflexi bacterium AL-W]NOK91076.1 hypothetical protein [Chloroflexi bacterium AL-N15]
MRILFVRSIALVTFAVLITLSLSVPTNTQAATSTGSLALFENGNCASGSVFAVNPGVTISDFGTSRNIHSSLRVGSGIYDATIYRNTNLSNSMYVLFTGPNPFPRFCDDWVGTSFF